MSLYCKRCDLHIPEGMTACRMCGNSLLAAPPVEPDGPTLFTKRHSPAGPQLSKWLFSAGLMLALMPLDRVYSITQREIPALFSDDGQLLLARYPGLDKVIWFEIAMNSLLVLAALVVNFFFYTRSRRFPKAMIAYCATALGYLTALAGLIHILFPDLNLAGRTISLMEYFLAGAGITAYLLFDHDVKNRFVH